MTAVPCLIPIILDIPMKINAGRRMRRKADIYFRRCSGIDESLGL